LSYQPNPSNNETALGLYLKKELDKISDEFRTNQHDSIEYEVHNVLPDKPRTGQAYYADGTNWNPGSGEGLYIYKSGGSWALLG